MLQLSDPATSTQAPASSLHQSRFTAALAAWAGLALGCVCLLGWLYFMAARALGGISSSSERWEWIRMGFGWWPYGVYGILLISCIAIAAGIVGARFVD